MDDVFVKGTYVFVPDEEEGFQLAKVGISFKRGREGVVEIRGKGKQKIPKPLSRQLVVADEASLESIDDLENVNNLSDAAILHNLRIRYDRDLVYTNLGSTMVSVNPYKVLPIYTPETMEEYAKTGGQGHPPHIYTLADRAFWRMVESGQSQYCIVNGESGSGKTELVKIFLQFITEISKGKEEAKVAKLQQRILASGPVLEAFGNAGTESNGNSSRFGKELSIQFQNRTGSLVSASITNYLLEKSRIVQQSTKGRNYHVFYGLCAAAQLDITLNSVLQLQHADQYAYLNQHDSDQSIPRSNDLRAFEDMVAAFDMFGVSVEIKEQIYRMLAGVLHLGNVSFRQEPETNQVAVDDSSYNSLERCAYLFGMESESLAASLVVVESRSSVSGAQQAMQARDSLAKAVYSNLFDWLVKTMNKSMACTDTLSKEDSSFISVLDIFGFENFGTNSFEQLCVNYCNEKLQNHFNKVTFADEIELYEKNGIDVSGVDFSDPTCLLVFEHPKHGVIHLLDSESKKHSGSDATALSKVVKGANYVAKETGKAFVLPDGRSSFTIVHYPGQVTYDVRGFVFKNQDVLSESLEMLCLSSSNNLFSLLFFDHHSLVIKEQAMVGASISRTETASSASRKLSSRLSFLKGRASKTSIGSSSRASQASVQSNPTTRANSITVMQRFSAQLSTLMERLKGCETHFVRCVRPNDRKEPEVFDAQMVLSQIKYSGLLDVCRIRQRGFPIRRDFDEFLLRYHLLAPDSADIQSLCKELVKRKVLVPGTWQAGYSKLFMKTASFVSVESAREKAVQGSTRQIQKLVVGHETRQQYVEYQTVISNLQAAVLSRDVNKLTEALLDTEDLPHEGDHVEEVKQAKVVLEELQDTQSAELELREALDAMQVGPLKRALTLVEDCKSKGIQDDLDPGLESRARKALESLMSTKDIVQALSSAISSRDEEALAAAIKVAEDVNLSPSKVPEYRHAIAVQVRMEEEKELVQRMRSALDTLDIDAVAESLGKMADFGGLEEHPEFIRGERVWTQVKRSSTVKSKSEKAMTRRVSKAKEDRKQVVEATLEVLRRATASNDINQLQQARVNVIKYNMKGEVVEEAMACYKRLNRENENVLELISAIDAANAAANSSRGMRAADVEELAGQVSVYKARRLPQSNLEFKQALELEEKLRKQFKIQKALEHCLKNDSIKHSRKVLEEANEMELNHLDVVGQVKGWIRKLQLRDGVSSERRLDAGAGFPAGGRTTRFASAIGIELRKVDEADYETQRMEKLKRARSPGFSLEHFPFIRSDADYSKGVGGLFSSSKRQVVARDKLRYQDSPVPRSLTVLGSAASKHAVVVHKSILGYCGDRVMAFPVVLAQRVLDDGVLHPELADEIYLQLCKQITGNEKRNSCTRAWQLMCMAVACFAPSPEFELHLINFLLQAAEAYGGDLLGGYARYALRRLESSLIRGPDRAAPAIEEIVAFQDRPPVLAKVELADGSVLAQDLPVDPMMQVSEVLKICRKYLGLTDPRANSFGIFFSQQRSQAPTGKAQLRKTLKRGEVSAAHAPPAQEDKQAAAKGRFTPTPPSGSSRSNKSQSTRNEKGDWNESGRSNKSASQGPEDHFATSTGSARSTASSPSQRVTFGSQGTGMTSSGSSFGSHRPIQKIPTPVFEPRGPPRHNKDKKPKDSKNANRAPPQPPPGPTGARMRPRPPPPRTEEEPIGQTPLAETEYVGDVVKRIVRRRAGDVPVFVFRRLMSYPPVKENQESTDPMYTRVLYIEATDEVISGQWVVSEEQLLAKLTAIAMRIDIGSFPTTPQALLFSKLGDYIPRKWSKKKNAMGWAKLVHRYQGYLEGKDATALQKEYLQLCRKLPNFGMIFFSVKQYSSPSTADGEAKLVPLVCAINWLGLNLMSQDKEQVLEVYPHDRISRLSATSTQLLLHVQKANSTKEHKVVTLRTLQAEAICSLLMEYNKT